jgi:hypothetical protein
MHGRVEGMLSLRGGPSASARLAIDAAEPITPPPARIGKQDRCQGTQICARPTPDRRGARILLELR